MGSCSSNMKNVPNAQKLMQETGFSSSHLLRLYKRFESLDRESRGHLRKEDFQAVRELSMNPVGDRIIGSFFSPGYIIMEINRKQWTFPLLSKSWLTFVTLRTTGSEMEHSKSQPTAPPGGSSLYDQDRDGKISRAELLQVLREMLGMQVTEEQLQSIAERAIQEANQDKDDAISFDEFRKSMEKVNIDHKMSIRFLE